MTDTLTTPQAIQEYHLNRHYQARLARLIMAGTIRATRVGRDWLLDRASLEAWLASPRKAGRRYPHQTVSSRVSPDVLPVYYERLKDAPGSHTREDKQHLYEIQEGKCFYCGKFIEISPTLDHIIPLARGGTNDVSNLVVACRSCNASKGTWLPEEWPQNPHKLYQQQEGESR